MEYINNLKELRSASKLHQSQAAEAIGIGQAEYSRMESGRRSVGYHKKAIAKAFGVKPDAIIERVKQDDSVFTTHTELPVFGFPIPNSNAFDFSKKMMSRVDCPPELESVEGAYAAFCYGDALKPKLSNGDLVFVCPSKEVKAGTLVVVKWKAGDKLYGKIVELVEMRKGSCEARMLAPEEFIMFDNIESVDQVVMTKYDI